METEPILKMCYIRKLFPGVIALDRVNFELRRGEVHILLGENGAGKSTLVKIISGAYQKDGGQILIDDREVEIRSPKRAQELGISIIYQELNLVPHLSAAENIYLGREPCRRLGIIDRKRLYQSAQRILNDLSVNIDGRTRVRDMGIAQQQMVEVAKALSLESRILIMDEPTSSLTDQEIGELFKTIRRLKDRGVSIIYISHRLEELFQIGDRVTVLRDGQYVGTHAIGDVDKSQLVRMMVDRDLTEQFPKQRAARGDEVLRVEGLTRRPHLKEISFSLRGGEVLGISGLLGAGRTELARAIFGVDRIDEGQIYIDGAVHPVKSPARAIRMGIGFLTEDRKAQGLVLTLSLKDNISLPNLNQFSSFGIINRKRETDTVKKYVSELRIKTPGLNQKTMYLSGGNQQKVVISKWICSRAKILIFDEPTRGIDVGSKVEIYQLMNQLTADGVAIMMISSDLPEILGMSDRILVMHEGRIAGEFTIEEATQENVLQCALGA